MASVEIRNVVKRYGALEIVHGISAEIADGEFVALVGPSGCGKSTLLRMIAGLEEISDGAVVIGGDIVNEVAPKDRNISMVFQNYALYPHMTVAENMAFALRLARLPKDEQKKKVGEAATMLGLEGLLDRYPGQLSGGQRQRVAMGRAIVRRPEVFLFDEPLSNLDAKLRVQMRAEIKGLHQRLRTTSIYVTHDQIEAMTMADRIVVMRDGNVEQIGTPLELFDNPRNLFVASFIGSPSMNFIKGEIVDGTFRASGGIVIPAANLGHRGPAVAGIRPNRLQIAATGPSAKVLIVEPTGDETHLLVELGGTQLAMLLRERVSLAPGDRIDLAFASADVHFFDSQSTLRLGSGDATTGGLKA
ncbi:ABC transporter ATP-binding protein [Sinorhizobium mexicanum]|uniref:sn-glycerol-3-phosphate ABC transporter ATP-binding protein UgpC n=1 Tax=Sinorhizobium mexicanum TaxID=375549 RepID=A0A859QS46_9HYPH|nr:sn-glycerol-3-phosphate ABC transporter ATP-binding protein UgpC [Sinorhizobium mexicanum]MBP1884270.1 multiple sugar transport system ATP-binding protein [Sinorhizobium mexicanum]QLL64967.1 sn-glycerol-3-phosphate ABC transporter ATP-binding protein UgpC [Sinorhizobium mexicanum]